MGEFTVTYGNNKKPYVQIDDIVSNESIGKLVRRDLKKFGKLTFEVGKLPNNWREAIPQELKGM